MSKKTFIPQKALFLIVFLLIIFPLFSQTNTDDALVRALKKQHFKEQNFNKASTFFIENNWDSTLYYSLQQLSKKQNSLAVKDICHYFRGYSFKKKKLFDEAQKEFQLISHNFEFYDFVKMNFGAIALEKSQFNEALSYYAPLAIRPKNNPLHVNRGMLFHNIGICHLHLNHFEEAERNLFLSENIQKENKDTINLTSTLSSIANLYYQQYNDQKAEKYFQKAYVLALLTNDFGLKKNATLNLAVVEENKKNSHKALIYRKEYEKWSDSLNDQNKIWALANLEKQFAVKQKQKEVTLLQAENKIKIAERNGLFYSALLMLLALGTGTYFYLQKIKSNRIISSQKQTLDELNATKDKLFSIVSHDLRSSVNALRISNAKLSDNLLNKKYELLDHQLQNNSAIANGTYSLLDNLLNWAMLQTKQLYFQIESIHLYSVIQQVTFNFEPLMLNKNIHFESDIPKSIFVMADTESLKIVLRNVLDNALKFSKENGFIKIYTLNTPNEITITIEDSGAGMSQEIAQELMKDTVVLTKKNSTEQIGSGLGLQLCKSMIKKNNGSFAIESIEQKGTKILITLPKQ